MEHLTDVPELREAWQDQVEERRAAARKVSVLLSYRDRRRAEAEAAGETVIGQAESTRAAVRDAAVMLGHAERTTAGLLNAAEFCRDDLPTCWRAFNNGLLDMARMRKIVTIACTLEDPAVLARLDAAAADYAAAQNPGKLGSWLNRFVASVDARAFETRCEQARQDRYVRFFHREDGMTEIEALLPTIQAASIEKRLQAVARGLDNPIEHPPEPSRPTESADVVQSQPTEHLGWPSTRREDDPRTCRQRQADLFGSWLAAGRIDGAPVDAKIAVLIPEETLTGESQAPGVSADRRWALPASAARDLARTAGAQHDWYITTAEPRPGERDRPVTSGARPAAGTDPPDDAEPLDPKNLLAVTYQGHDPPEHLRQALVFRDGTCQAPGCTVSAVECDLDHQVPWPEGDTSAANLWMLCRTHHRLKGHGHLTPPKGHGPTARTRNDDVDECRVDE